MKRIWILLALIFLPGVLLGQATITVTDASINVNDQVNWTADNEYVLDGLVFVEEGAVLTIQAGTVVRAKEVPTTGNNTSALIIARGGKLYANGSADLPIIFTAESDDLGDANDLLPEDRGLWGGVILLGRAEINTTTGVGQIEGIDPNEPRGQYGGDDDKDNSGVMRYVSIRHGGSEIGAGNEINGLTFGAVGDGTVIEHIEVFSNLDDGYEWFGGTVNTKWLIAAYCGDDGFDYDEGFRGKGQFWFAIQGTDAAGRVGEHDGGTSPEDGQPYATPWISNATYIGPGVNAFPQGDGDGVFIFRDNAGGRYYNSIFTDYNGAEGGAGITVEDLASGEDSRARLEGGDLVLMNNIWWMFGDGNTLSDIAPQQFVADVLGTTDNDIVDPQLSSINRTNAASLDPRPIASGPAGNGAMALPNDGFYSQVTYYGAFDPNAPLWIGSWTALQADITTRVEEETVETAAGLPDKFGISQNYPNPFNPSTEIVYELPRAAGVTIKIYSILGAEVSTLVDGFRPAGVHEVTWQAGNLPSGIYFYHFRAGGVVEIRKMALTK